MYSPYTPATSRVFALCILFVSLSVSSMQAITPYAVHPNDSVPQRHSFIAAQLCQENKMDESIKEIEIAIADKEESLDMYTWYVRGFIYKEKFKIETTTELKNSSREIAVESFLKSEEMAAKMKEATLNHNTALKYLASTYYNDALLAAGQLIDANDLVCESYLKKYHELVGKTEPGHDFTNEDKMFNNAKAQRLYMLWLAQPENETLFNASKQAFETTITLDPTDCSSKYNLAVLLHNHVANHYRTNSAGTLEKCCQGKELCAEAIQWSQKAVELCQQAYDLCPTAEIRQALNVCRKTLELPAIEEIKN